MPAPVRSAATRSGAIVTLRDECNALLRSERTIWMDTVAALRSDVETGLADATRRAGQLTRRADEADEVQQERLLDAVADVRATIEHERHAQENANRLRSARRDALTHQLDRALVIVSAPRFGSSWLFDVLRRHGDVGVYPTADLFARLGANGRRYPAALSDALTDGVDIEVQRGLGGLVPGGYRRVAGVDAPWRSPRFVVERVQPSAIDFDPTGFADRVGALRSDLGGEHQVKLIFMTRDPVDAVRSFLVYRGRHPAWRVEIPDEFVHDFYRRSYESIATIHHLVPGTVVTWESLRDEPARRLARLLYETGIEPDEPRALSVATEMVSGAAAVEDDASESDRDVPDASLVELGIGTFDPARAQDAIGRAREVHQRLSRSSTESTGSPGAPPTYG